MNAYGTWRGRPRVAEHAVPCPLCKAPAGDSCRPYSGLVHTARARYWRREEAASVLGDRCRTVRRAYSLGQLTMPEVVTLTARAMVLFEAEAKRWAD